MSLFSRDDIDRIRKTLIEGGSDATLVSSTIPDRRPPSMLTDHDKSELRTALLGTKSIDDYILQPTDPLQSDDRGVAAIVQQRRPGTRHGKGGRPRGSTRTGQVPEIKRQVEAAMCHALLHGSDHSELARVFCTSASTDPEAVISTEPRAQFEERFSSTLRGMAPRHPIADYHVVPGPILSICSTRMTTSATGVRVGKVMDKHALCMWLNRNGEIFCSCYGSTAFRITFGGYRLKLHERDRCVHVSGMNSFIEKLSTRMDVPFQVCARSLAASYQSTSGVCVTRLSLAVPEVHPILKRSGVHSLFVLVEKDFITHEYMYIPVRNVMKGKSFLVCCFCDNTGVKACHHLGTVRDKIRDMDLVNDSMEADNTATSVFTNPSSAFINESDVLEESSYLTPTEEVSAISHLPLSPVNCATATSVDKKVSNISVSGGAFLISAPSACPSPGCDGQRNPKSRNVSTDGVIMCSTGPCAFHYETFQCGDCQSQIYPEGRENYVVLDTRTTAATHAWLRTELIGVVLCNGTLTGRLKHYIGQVSSYRMYGLTASTVPCRSVQTLRRLCSIMLKLMCMDPPRQLYECQTCEYVGNDRKPRMSALCMDGINQGYLLKCKKGFQNISEVCHSRKVSTASGKRSIEVRPLDTLLRGTNIVKILCTSIEGRPLQCNSTNVKHFAAAIRVVSQSALPRFFSMGSICGRSSTNYSDDIGPNCTLISLRELFKVLLNTKVLLKRLLLPLHSYLETCTTDELEGLGGLPRVQSASNKWRRPIRSAIDMTAATLSELRQVDDEMPGISWAEELESTHSYIKADIFRLTKTFLQGPVTQFLRKSEIGSAECFASFCALDNPNLVQNALENNTLLPQNLAEPGSDAVHIQTFISRSIVLKAGFKSLIDLEIAGSRTARSVRQAFAPILRVCAERVHQFYSYYDDGHGTKSATMYASRWASRDATYLRDKIVAEYGSHRALAGNTYDIACTTGFYFPYRSQIRPLPFNDEELIGNEDDEGPGYCSKNYLQQQKSFTPGCLTFVCTCSHPLILGLKAIHRDEGPRVVLDSIVSRFASPPTYIIYDFACGLHTSARHSLWWTLEDSSVVSDFFHSRNHSCSPSFEPGAHTAVAMANTVAHEQRNRAIQQLARSLRNSSKELYLTLLAFQASILNLQAKAKSSTLFHERPIPISEYSLEWAFFVCVRGKCYCCAS